MNLSGSTAWVTGAARGLGRHFALELLRAGARVAAGDVDHPGLRQLRRDAGERAGELLAAPLDVTVEDSVCSFVATASERFGAPRVVINNAGILRDGLLVERDGDQVRRLPARQWDHVLRTNLTGCFLVAREAVARMLQANQGGVVVNVSSLARSGNAGQSSYAASKAGLDACTRTWALELAPHGVRVGGVAPGLIDTPMLEDIAPDRRRALIGSTPAGRAGRPDEVWQAVRFIIECDFFNGRTIEVDGGAAMGGTAAPQQRGGTST
jgi:3-oxoacyl-[acyl-carrier protein] reductase